MLRIQYSMIQLRMAKYLSALAVTHYYTIQLGALNILQLAEQGIASAVNIMWKEVFW